MTAAMRSLQHTRVDCFQHTRSNLQRSLTYALFGVMSVAGCQCEDGLGVLSASVELEPAQLDFQDVPLRNTKMLPLKIWNRGSFVLSISDFTATGPFTPPVVTTTIGIGYHEEVMVGFTPTELGSIEGQLTFQTSDPEAPTVTVPLKGVGIEAAILVDPSIVDFGEVIWKTRNPSPKSQTVTISNPGSDSFDLTSIALTDDGQGVFSLDAMMAKTTYAPGDSETIEVSFAPTSKGMHSGSLEILNTTPSAPSIVVPLQGKAVGPILNLCVNQTGGQELCSQNGDIPRLDFGFVDPAALGTGSVRVANDGDRTLEIDQTLVTGSDEYFTFSPTIVEDEKLLIDPGQQRSWDVTFTPDNYRPGTIVVSFTTNASNNDASNVSGASSARIDAKVGQPTIVVQPQRVTFSHVGSIDRGQTKVRIFSCGTKNLVIENVSLRHISGTPQPFSLENTPGAGVSIPPQNCGSDPAQAEFDVVFSSTVDGNYQAEATIQSNDPNTPNLTIAISGSKS
jgi:hypothetical protein